MEFQEVVRRRRMVRHYDPIRRIDRARVDRLIDLARRAPSAGFTQGSHFLVLDDDAGREAYWSSTTDPATPPDEWLTGMRAAPVLIVVLSERAAYERRYARPDKVRSSPKAPEDPPTALEDRWPVPYWDVDAGMAALLILLGAVDAGLGACFFGVPTTRVAAMRARLNVPEALTPVGVVSLGHPEPDHPQPSSHPEPRQPEPSHHQPPRPRRRPRTEQVSYGRYGRPT